MTCTHRYFSIIENDNEKFINEKKKNTQLYVTHNIIIIERSKT